MKIIFFALMCTFAVTGGIRGEFVKVHLHIKILFAITLMSMIFIKNNRIFII